MADELVVFTQPGCPPCHAATEFLSQNNIEFTEKDIQKDPAFIQELIATGSQSTPTITMGDKVMIGFRKNELLEWVGKA